MTLSHVPEAVGNARGVRTAPVNSLRILAVSHTWEGANDYSYICALRRAGHSVTVASDDNFIPAGWRNPALKAVRRILHRAMVADFNSHLINTARALKPELFFVYKGTHVSPQALAAVKEAGAVAINVYPDTNFALHSHLLLETMRRYDWVFTTKSFHIEAPPAGIDASCLSLLPHGYDPEVHRPLELDEQDRARYGADVACIMTWTPAKERLLARLHALLPDVRLKIWGNLWERATADLGPGLMGRSVLGVEYGKAIQAATITLALLVERMGDAIRGDLVTARTFEIPAAGGFMLHERNAEVAQYFAEGRECAMFDGAEEMVEQVRYYLVHPQERAQIAAAGHARCIAAGYSYDDRAATVVNKAQDMLRMRARTC